MYWVMVHWESIALAILPLLAIHYCWGFREHMNLWAWGFFGIFVALFFASNSWRFVPFPDDPTLEQGRLWLNDARLIHTISLKWCAVAAVGLAFIAGLKGQIKGACALLMATVVLAMFGEATEFSYCRLRDPVKGFAHIYYYEGGTESVCGRLAEAGVGTGFGWIGVWLTPALTVVPSVVAMGWTARRKRAG